MSTDIEVRQRPTVTVTADSLAANSYFYCGRCGSVVPLTYRH